ncbi:MAG TPA: hypoxanthine phosphoribosyltransferase [Bacteroides sp.]|nr:hypoxanthine phosphoribosyltransferase [Bacteroides sp.]HER10024.1 hypoxanthine phosphoribosyltransferase [Bacteroides sp.]
MVPQIVRVDDRQFRLYIGQAKIEQEVTRIAGELERDFSAKDPIFMPILNGAFMFASDLFRKFDFPCQITFLKLASYSGTGSTGTVKQLIGINRELKDRVVVVLEDIVDTGITLETILRQLSGFQPAEVRVATFLHKPDCTIREVRLDYVGMEIPNDFVVGYGLDYNEYGRNLREIYQVVE